MKPIDRRTFLAGSVALAASAEASQEQETMPEVTTEESQQLLPGSTKNTRFAVNVEMWFRRLPFVDRIKAASDLGFPAIEFWELKGKDLEAIAKVCEECAVEVAQFTAWGFVPGLNHPKNHEAWLGALNTAVEAAAILGARKATVVGGNDQPGMTQQEMHDNIVTGLKLAAPVAEEADLMLILEPMNIRVDHKGHCLYGSPPGIAICRRVASSHVKLNWDLYHMQISEGDLCGHLREGIEEIGYLQLADHPGRAEPGTGEVNYSRVLREAKQLGYTGYVGLECWARDGEETAAKRVSEADKW
jgi:hydroxypyruvate isomerase